VEGRNLTSGLEARSLCSCGLPARDPRGQRYRAVVNPLQHRTQPEGSRIQGWARDGRAAGMVGPDRPLSPVDRNAAVRRLP